MRLSLVTQHEAQLLAGGADKARGAALGVAAPSPAQPRHAGHFPPAAAPVPQRSGAAREAGAPARLCPAGRRGRVERSPAVSGRSAAALAGARLSGCGRGGEGSGSGSTFPRRRAKLNSQRRAAAFLSPPGSEPSANPLVPPRPARAAGGGGQRGASLPRGAGTPALPGGAGAWESVPEAPRPAEPPV